MCHPCAQSGHVILVVLKRIAREESPGDPLLRHVLEVMGVVEVIVAERLCRCQQIGVSLLLFAQDLLQRALPVLLVLDV